MDKKHVFLNVVIVIFIGASVIALLQAQDTPAQIDLALEHLSAEAGEQVTLDTVSSWRWTGSVFTDTSLGCPQPDEDYLLTETRGYIFEIVYEGQRYDYRVSDDNRSVILCSVIDATVTTATPEDSIPATATGQPVATAVAAALSVDYDDIRFMVDEDVASDVMVWEVPPVMPGDDVLPFDIHPEYVEFQLTDYAATGITQGVIAVYDVADYEALLPDEIPPAVDRLIMFIESCPDLPAEETFPELPPRSGQQVFVSNAACLSFENGSGIRYLTAFRLDVWPLTNDDLVYVFQGITHDRSHLVTATLPVNTAALPDIIDPETLDYDAFAETFDTYLAETVDVLNAQPPADFTPDLSLLDSMMSSFTVASDAAGMQTVSWEQAQELINAGQVTTVTQLHSLEVTLQLDDGSTVTTTEPAIDDVFDVIRACGDPCSDIVVATE